MSLTVNPGEVWCLLGANGAGKTTLLNACLGFIALDRGEIAIGGLGVGREPMAARANVGYVPEHVLLYDAMSGVEHVSFFASLSGRRITQDEARQRLEDAGLHGGVVGRRVGTYSKGMRQKVALAIALAKPAPALLLDEPLSGLDPKSAIELSARLRALSQAGRAVLLTSHDLFRALETASHIGIMRAGRLQHVIAAARLDYADLERLYLESMGD